MKCIEREKKAGEAERERQDGEDGGGRHRPEETGTEEETKDDKGKGKEWGSMERAQFSQTDY